MRKKIILIILSVVAAAVLALILLYFIVFNKPNQYIPSSLGEIGCIYTLSVQGDSMEPAISSGQIISMNKCVDDKDNLVAGQIVLYLSNGRNTIGRISEKVTLLEGISYKITRDNRPGEEITITPSEVIAVGGD